MFIGFFWFSRLLAAMIPFHLGVLSPVLTRAETTDFTATSRYADVLSFIEEIKKLRPQTRVETFGTSVERRALPLVILAGKRIDSPKAAHGSGKPIVFILANIHAGEVEGKEAAQIIMREVAAGSLKGLLDRIVLLIAPIYNADGNERIDFHNRTSQNGPSGGVGIRENANGLDLNRDFMKLDSSEAQGLVDNVFNRWDPHLLIDLHTTNGSYHGYALTYSPPLNPNTDPEITGYLRKKLLPHVSKQLRDKHRYETYYYGNFAPASNPSGERTSADGIREQVWATFDSRPRFSTNYYGLRNRLAILSEAYSYLDFRTRVDVTYRFVTEILQFVADHDREIVKLTQSADEAARRYKPRGAAEGGFALSATLKGSQQKVPILAGSVMKVKDPSTGLIHLEAGRDSKPVLMKELGEFTKTDCVPVPRGWLVMPGQDTLEMLIKRHGIEMRRIEKETVFDVIEYHVMAVERASRSFQGHHETRLELTETQTKLKAPNGSTFVPAAQAKAALAFELLEPTSADGAVNWNVLDSILDGPVSDDRDKVLPIYRVTNHSESNVNRRSRKKAKAAIRSDHEE